MQAFNIEIFDPDFTLVQHSNINDISYNVDYLSPVENSVTVPFNSAITSRDYVHIYNNDHDYFGIIVGTDTSQCPEGWVQLRYKPFTSLFDAPIMFDTDYQGSATSLEDCLAGIITDYWASNSDTSQNITGLSVSTISTTSNWGFNLKSDVEDMHKCIINFRNVLISRALSKYRVGVYVTPDFENQTISIEVGVKSNDTYYIEAALPNVIIDNVVMQEGSYSVNKLVVYSEADMTSTITYYLHPDGTFNTTNNNRVTPVIFDTVSVSVDNTTFAEAALEAAQEAFVLEGYKNLIELTVLNNDSLVRPDSLDLGQLVSIISNGVSYPSILTGYEIGNTTKLIFGSIRVDLTKILKGA